MLQRFWSEILCTSRTCSHGLSSNRQSETISKLALTQPFKEISHERWTGPCRKQLRFHHKLREYLSSRCLRSSSSSNHPYRLPCPFYLFTIANLRYPIPEIGMADLKARIGPKAGQFANKTWVRPGLVTQHSPKRKLRLSTTADRSFDQNSDFSHDDSDQDEQEESHSRSVSPSHNSTGKPNLMARMGITHLDYEEPEVSLSKEKGVPKPQKSLLERVSDKRNDDENSLSFSVPSNGISIGPDVVVAKSDVDQGMRPKQIRSVSQSVRIPVCVFLFPVSVLLFLSV